MRFAFVLVLAACHKAPAIAADAAQPNDGNADAPPSLVTGIYVLRTVINDAAHLPTILDVPARSLTATVKLDDGQTPPVDLRADGSFSFLRGVGQSYRITFVQDGAPPVEYQSTAARLDISPRLWGRYDRAAVTPNTALAVTATNAPGSGLAVVDSTGVWMQTGRDLGANNAFTIDWTKTASLSGTRGLLDATANDRGFVTIHDAGGTNPAYTRLTHACSFDVSMSPGVTTLASCTMQPLVADHCTHVVAPIATELARISSALAGGPVWPNPTYTWLIAAAPMPSLGTGGALLLAYVGGVPTGDIDRNLTTYSNPFPGHDTTLGMTVGRLRNLMLPGTTTPLVLGASTQQFVKPSDTCATASVISGVLALAGLPALDGVVLASDSLSFELDRSRDHDLTWPIAAPGLVDFWAVQLFAVTNVANTTQIDLRRTWIANDPHVVIDPASLEPNTYYILSVLGISAYSNAATGDFRTIGYPAKPYGTGRSFSAMFRVTN